MIRKTPACIALILPILLTLGAAEARAISWGNDLKSALKEAKQSQKHVIVDFYTTWCQWSKELDYNTYSDTKVNDLSGNFICVKVDAEKNPQAALKYNIGGYPTVIFLNYDGSVNYRVLGYRDPEDFVSIMESVLRNIKIPRDKMVFRKAAAAAVQAPDSKDAGAVKFDKEEFERKQKKNIDKVRNRGLKLNGIIINRQKALVAVINNIFVREGDSIGAGRVSKITKDKAEVAFQDKTIILTMD